MSDSGDVKNRDQFEAVIEETIAGLPDWVHDALENIEIHVDEEPTREQDPHGERLLGLYDGTPLTERGVDYVGELPDIIYIFRQPHLEMQLSPEELREQIAVTLIHEIAHYFGIEDDHLEDIGWG